ncbi:MAG TPA: hypothetical protein PLF40_00110 [Kofleriaceae bacterium]|nr:hypothetical protein [Kofleriaceae bacterium]
MTAVPTLTAAQQHEFDVAFEAIRADFAAQHLASRTAMGCDVPPHLYEELFSWLDAFFQLVDEVTAWELAAEQADVPALDNPTQLSRFQALVSVPLTIDAERALLRASERLQADRVLALAAIIGRRSTELHNDLAAELARTCDVEATWALLDWLGTDTDVLVSLVAARQRSAQARDDANRVQDDDATRWLVKRGFAATAPFDVSIRMQDVPVTHPKHRHLREQVSVLTIDISTRRMRGPDLDRSWSLKLLGASGAAIHGFLPSRWSGNFWQVQRNAGEMVAVFEEPSSNVVRKGVAHTIRATLETLPTVINEIEALTGRSFHRDSAAISASLGDKSNPALVVAVRAWLSADDS